ncbi:SusC/RagA family TonB-linked outer membrane protein [Joostella sp. CR20]|uniref:SusC/RagA family TonB-linked outer membrane protein n=1 Tax=Joostella sp. CR20 TaxID=2804312 RepID=UPI00313CF9B1
MKRLLFTMSLLLCCSLAFSQTITGTVTDEQGTPLPGVSVVVSQSSNGTSTDFDGKYQINANSGDVIVFTYVGMKTVKKTVGTNQTINVTLLEDAQSLDEVVVTAFGIKKDERSLGYSVTQLDAKDVEIVGEQNPLSSLQGRVSGVQVSKTSGSSGGGVDILIRGITSIDPSRNNQPLIIVDGIAYNNDTFSGNVLPSAGSNSPDSAEQFSFSNRAGDINPEDIESFSVLKGAAATALYGVRASNGAIIITTKKGKQGKAQVNISASTSFREVEKTPDVQTTYREGFGGLPRTIYAPDSDTGFDRVQNSTSFYSWGPRYSDDSATLSDGTVVDLTGDKYYSPYDLFRTGVNKDINFNISGADDKFNYYFSLGRNEDEGILPNTNYDKTTFRLKGGYQITDNFNMNASVAYTKSGGARATSGDKSVMSSLYYYSGTFPINDYINPDGSERDYSFGIIDNPRYLMENSSLVDDVNRWVGNTIFNWTPKEWLTINYSAQIDNYSDQRNRFVPPDVDAGAAVGGFIVNQNINFTAIESNFLATATKEWSEKFVTELTVGNQVTDTKRIYTDVRGETLNIDGLNDLTNTLNTFATKTITQLRNVGIFGELKATYNNSLFLTITGRNDWVSTLPSGNRSFFYPSVSLAYDLASLLDNKEVFSFGKLRASWAEVGKAPLFGQIGDYFVSDTDFPFGGQGGYTTDITKGDPNIVPERTQSYEIGADLRFFNNRLRFDYAYYKSRVKDQIFAVSTANSSGMSSYVRNAGDFETFGHELMISGDIIKNESFTWEVILNWNTNEGKVLEIPDDVESVIFADSGFPGVTSEIREGDKMGNLYGYKWTYVDGERLIDESGFPIIDTSEKVVVGNAFPDFTASIGNNLSYKNFSFNFLIDWKNGGDLYDAGLRNSIRNGVPQSTEFRYENTVLSGVLADGTPNTQEVYIDENYYRNSNVYNRAAEVIVQDASWVKLRNVGLTYNFGRKVLETLKMNRLSISASAQNILIWTPFDGYDPEGNQYSAGSNVYGFTGLNIPLSQSYSLGLNIGF